MRTLELPSELMRLVMTTSESSEVVVDWLAFLSLLLRLGKVCDPWKSSLAPPLTLTKVTGPPCWMLVTAEPFLLVKWDLDLLTGLATGALDLFPTEDALRLTSLTVRLYSDLKPELFLVLLLLLEDAWEELEKPSSTKVSGNC